MKKKLLLVSLFILPVLLFILNIIFKDSIGEYFLYFNYDGSYKYLLASLNIVQLEEPGYTQHPGIVPQLISAGAIKLFHLFQGNDSNIVLDTFNRPEFYLNRINLVFAFLTSFTLYFLGRITYEKIGNIFAAIFLQLTPFITVISFNVLVNNPVHATNIILILVLLTITISFLNEEIITEKRKFYYIILYGIICGLLVANLISNLPIFIIPFLLIKRFVHKIYFVLISILTFCILFFSITAGTSQIWGFVINNIIHSGKYGAGPSNFIDFNRAIPSFEKIFRTFFFFSIIYLLISATLLLQLIPKFRIQIRNNKYSILLTAIFIIMSLYILLVIKQIEMYYLLPGVMFSVIGLFSVNSIFYDLFPRNFKFGRYSYLFIISIVFTYPQIKNFKKTISFFTSQKMESYKVIEYLKDNYPNTIVVSSDFTSSIPTAFYHGLNNSPEPRRNYLSILSNKYPNYVYFQRWMKDFIYINQNPELKNRLINSDSLVFHSFDDANFNDFEEKLKGFTNKPNLTYKEVFANKNGEKLYVVYLK